MGIWNLFKKKGTGLSYYQFENWLDTAMNRNISTDVVAFCFNLYDDAGKKWTLELVGASSFDANDSDWACDEVFTTRDNPLIWYEEVNGNWFWGNPSR